MDLIEIQLYTEIIQKEKEQVGQHYIEIKSLLRKQKDECDDWIHKNEIMIAKTRQKIIQQVPY